LFLRTLPQIHSEKAAGITDPSKFIDVSVANEAADTDIDEDTDLDSDTDSETEADSDSETEVDPEADAETQAHLDSTTT